jgi:hypothetical protein
VPKNRKQKAPVLLEDEGLSRIVVPPPFTRSRVPFAVRLAWEKVKLRRDNGRSPETNYCQQKAGFIGRLKGVTVAAPAIGAEQTKQDAWRCFHPPSLAGYCMT